MNLDALALLPGRCQHGFAPQHTDHRCGASAEPSGVDAAYPVFVAALRRAVREDQTIHATDVRRELAAQQIPPRTLSSCWRRAKSRGLLDEVGIERSDDHKGRNAGRPEPYYRLAA